MNSAQSCKNRQHGLQTDKLVIPQKQFCKGDTDDIQLMRLCYYYFMSLVDCDEYAGGHVPHDTDDCVDVVDTNDYGDDEDC